MIPTLSYTHMGQVFPENTQSQAGPVLSCLPSFQAFSSGNGIWTFHQWLWGKWDSPPPATGSQGTEESRAKRWRETKY